MIGGMYTMTPHGKMLASYGRRHHIDLYPTHDGLPTFAVIEEVTPVAPTITDLPFASHTMLPPVVSTFFAPAFGTGTFLWSTNANFRLTLAGTTL